jgi:hypothetical protein
MEYIDSVLVSLKALSLYIQVSFEQIPYTQLTIAFLSGGIICLAYNVKKDIRYLEERLNTHDVDIKCAHAIARMCDDDIATANIPEIHRDIDILHSNITKAVGLLEILNKVDIVNKKEIQHLKNSHTHDTTVYQQWYGMMKGDTQYGQLELTITVTNMEFNTKSQNDFWLSTLSNSNSYIDEVINDILCAMSKQPFSQKEHCVTRDSLGFSGLVRMQIEWNDVGRYYEVPEYFKKYMVQWEKKLVSV